MCVPSIRHFLQIPIATWRDLVLVILGAFSRWLMQSVAQKWALSSGLEKDQSLLYVYPISGPAENMGTAGLALSDALAVLGLHRPFKTRGSTSCTQSSCKMSFQIGLSVYFSIFEWQNWPKHQFCQIVKCQMFFFGTTVQWEKIFYTHSGPNSTLEFWGQNWNYITRTYFE